MQGNSAKYELFTNKDFHKVANRDWRGERYRKSDIREAITVNSEEISCVEYLRKRRQAAHKLNPHLNLKKLLKRDKGATNTSD